MKSLIALIAFAFLAQVSAAPCGAQGIELDRVVAVVNNEAITWLELYKAMDFELSRSVKGPITEKEKKRLLKDNEAAFLEDMVNVRLQLSAARNLNIYVGEGEIESAVKSIMEANSMDSAAFDAALRAEGLTPKGYRERLRDDITLRRLIDREVRSRVIVTDEEVLASLGPEERAGDEPQYKVSQIFFKEGADDLAAAAFDRLKAGEEFRAIAAEFSDDPQAGKTGGDLGLIVWSDLSPEFQEAVQGLKPGEASKPFRTEAGIHIIMVEDRKTSERFEEIRKRLFDEAMEKEHKEWLRRLREKSFVQIKL